MENRESRRRGFNRRSREYVAVTLGSGLALISAGIALGLLLRGRVGWCYVFATLSVIIGVTELT